MRMYKLHCEAHQSSNRTLRTVGPLLTRWTLKPGMKWGRKGLKSWISKGITTFYSLIEKGQLKHFERLREDYDLERTDFYRFLQVRSHFEHNIRKETDRNDPILNIFIDAYQSKSNKGVISRIHKGLLSKKSHTTGYVKEKWEREGNLLISEEDWLDICQSQWKCTSSHGWREFGWKCIVRFFITPKTKGTFYWRGSYVLETVWTPGSWSLAYLLGVSSGQILLDRASQSIKRHI